MRVPGCSARCCLISRRPPPPSLGAASVDPVERGVAAAMALKRRDQVAAVRWPSCTDVSKSARPSPVGGGSHSQVAAQWHNS